MAHFGLRYFAQLRSKYKGVFWRVEIAERDYSGTSEEMEFAGGSPLSITWENRGDEFYVPVKASEATINVMCRDNFHFIGLFTSDPRKFRVSIYRNTVLYWRGFVVADLYYLKRKTEVHRCISAKETLCHFDSVESHNKSVQEPLRVISRLS